jgi:predicted protein tyrosine phosphatase
VNDEAQMRSADDLGRWLDRWEEKVYLVAYAPRGISRDTALLHWQMLASESESRRQMEESKRHLEGLRASLRPADDDWKDKT